jgi:hypothetical protein
MKSKFIPVIILLMFYYVSLFAQDGPCNPVCPQQTLCFYNTCSGNSFTVCVHYMGCPSNPCCSCDPANCSPVGYCTEYTSCSSTPAAYHGTTCVNIPAGATIESFDITETSDCCPGSPDTGSVNISDVSSTLFNFPAYNSSGVNDDDMNIIIDGSVTNQYDICAAT